MQRPRSPVIRRPKMASADTARDHKQAAMQLVRLEFEINRLKRALSTSRQRTAMHKAELEAQQSERAKLLAVLTQPCGLEDV